MKKLLLGGLLSLLSIQAQAYDQASIFTTNDQVFILNTLKCEIDPSMNELFLVKAGNRYYKGCWVVEHSMIHLWVKDLNYTTHIDKTKVKFERQKDST